MADAGHGHLHPLCPSRHPPQSVAACLSRRGPAHPLSHGHQVTRDHLRRIGPGGGRAGDGSTQGSRPARLRGVEQAHARLSGSGAAIADAGRRDQRRVWLSRSEMPWLQHAPDRCPRHRAATEGNAGPRTRTLHALPPVLRSPGLSLQAEPSGGCDRPRSPRAIRPRHGGRGNGDAQRCG